MQIQSLYIKELFRLFYINYIWIIMNVLCISYLSSKLDWDFIFDVNAILINIWMAPDMCGFVGLWTALLYNWALWTSCRHTIPILEGFPETQLTTASVPTAWLSAR